MSFQAMAWAVKQRAGSSSSKLVLLSLANFANDNFECFPSIARIADDCEMSERTVLRAIKSLEDAGLVAHKKQGKNGMKTASRYFLNPQNSGCDTVSDRYDNLSNRYDNLSVHDMTDCHIEPIKVNLSINQLPKLLDAFKRATAKVYGGNRVPPFFPSITDKHFAEQFEKQGVSEDQFYQKVLSAQQSKYSNQQEPISSMKYFEKAFTVQKTEEPDFWAVRMNLYRERGIWPEEWGPSPAEQGCEAPEQYLRKAS